MKAGQTNLEVGTRVKLKTKEKELNGLFGSVTHPFAFGETKKGWIGIWLDGGNSNTPYGGQCNVKESEVEIVIDYSDAEYYIEKFGQKMVGSSKETAKEWIEGANLDQYTTEYVYNKIIEKYY
jgi:hypothetical protein